MAPKLEVALKACVSALNALDKPESQAQYLAILPALEKGREALASYQAMGTQSQWIDWPGGECPVRSNIQVEIKTRNEEFRHGLGFKFYWNHNRLGYPGNDDIIAYRIMRA